MCVCVCVCVRARERQRLVTRMSERESFSSDENVKFLDVKRYVSRLPAPLAYFHG